MTVYIRIPYGRFPRHRRMGQYQENWEVEESQAFFPVEVYEKNDEFIIIAMLPGMKPKDVEIQIANETVSLKGEFRNEIDEEANYILQVRSSGRFFRSNSMSDMMNASKAEASMDNGILTLRIHKAEEAKPKTIKVTTVKK